MVVAAVCLYIKVVYRIVKLLIIDIHKACNLWECLFEMLHQSHCRCLLVLICPTELHDEHPLARIAVANHHVAEQTLVLAKIVERQVVGIGIVARIVTNRVAEVVHQPALFDRKNLVETARDMEAYAVHVLVLNAALHLLVREPALVAESEFEFVTIELCLLASQNRTYLRKFNLADSRQIICNLLLLCLQLLLILQTLPLAASANAVVLAERCVAQLRIMMNVHNLCLGITVLLSADLQIHHIAGHNVRSKYHKVIDPCKRLALGSHGLYRNILQQRELFFLSCHNLPSFITQSFFPY